MTNENANGEPPLLTHQEVTDGLAIDQRIADYTIASLSREVDRLKAEVKQWQDEARRRSELATHNEELLKREIDKLKGELSLIDNLVKEALKECLKQ